MGKITRRGNAILAALITLFFLGHMLLGGLRFAGVSFPFDPSLLLRAGFSLVLVHVALSAATSLQMLLDTVRPPSVGKKRHLALKWASGLAVLVAAAVHIASLKGLFSLPDPAKAFLLLICLALTPLFFWHFFVGTKSLLKDIGKDTARRNRYILRFLVFLACAVVAAVLLFALL